MSKMRILFVDDDLNVLQGLRRMLHKQQDQWDCVFVASGAEALEQLAATPFDAIVTDMQMPGMSGAELLETVVAKYPAVARIILSGHTDEVKAACVVKIAHQFLSKPIDPETLQAAVNRACAARRSIPSHRMRSIVASVGTLPSPPDIYVEITKTIAADKADARQVARVVSRDPALSAKLLQLVNTSFFGLGRPVSSVAHAVTLLGLTRLKLLVMTAQILDQFRASHAIRGFSVGRLLRRCLLTARVARLISQAELQNGDQPDQAYAAGLLHDVGLLVLAARQATTLDTVMRRTEEEGIALCDAEQDVIGATHPEIGACLLELWGLPQQIVEAVMLHHNPNEVGFEGVTALTVVHAAAALSASVAPHDALPNEELVFAPELDAAYLTRVDRLTRVEAWKQLVVQAVQAP